MMMAITLSVCRVSCLESKNPLPCCCLNLFTAFLVIIANSRWNIHEERFFFHSPPFSFLLVVIGFCSRRPKEKPLCLIVRFFRLEDVLSFRIESRVSFPFPKVLFRRAEYKWGDRIHVYLRPNERGRIVSHGWPKKEPNRGMPKRRPTDLERCAMNFNRILD